MGRWFRRGHASIVIVVVVLLVASACGNSEDGESAATTTATPPDAASTVTASPGTAPPGTTAPAEGSDVDAAAERDAFVPLAGVPGVSDDEITFAVVGTRANNPIGSCILDCYVDGIRAYFSWRNDEGGIYGRQLTLGDVLDDEVTFNLDRAEEVVASDTAFGAFVATLVASGFGALNDAGVPTYVWGIHGPEAAGRQAIFGHLPTSCFECTNRYIPYLARRAGAGEVAVLGYGVTENSKACVRAYADSIERYGDELGLELAYVNDGLSFGLPNGIAPEVSAIKDAGVDFVATCMDLNAMRTLGEEVRRQGVDVTLFHPNSYNQAFIAENAEIFEGDYVVTQFAPFEYDTGLEQQARFREYMAAQGSDETELAMIGWINADQAFAALLAAGPEFDRQAVIDAANQMTDFSAGGLINPIDWTRQHEAPIEGDPSHDFVLDCAPVVQVADGAFEPIGDDPTKPWLCWPNDTLDWSEPVPTGFGPG